MPTTFLIADPHFGHIGVTKFLCDDGSKMRPWDCPDEMDNALVQNWNSVVRPQDRVYVLGDVVINRRCLPTIARCNGKKVLVKGNHDIFKLHEYAEYFDDIRGTWMVSNLLLSHIPVHAGSFGRCVANVHGHLHYRQVTNGELVDPRYVCVSVEQINYTPVTLESVLEEVKQRGLLEPPCHSSKTT